MTATNETRAIGNKAGAIGERTGKSVQRSSAKLAQLHHRESARSVLRPVCHDLLWRAPKSGTYLDLVDRRLRRRRSDRLSRRLLARRYGLVTTLGRILDPFVDKIIVCGAFIFLSAKGSDFSGVGPWMVLIVIGREMFVTGLRSFLEQQGKDFSASLSGKLKMFAQCIAVGASLLSMNPVIATTLPWFAGFRDCLLWLAVAITLVSGIIYIRRASQLLRSA